MANLAPLEFFIWDIDYKDRFGTIVMDSNNSFK